MNYHKLLTDYLNFKGFYNDYIVLNFEERGTFIEVYYSFDNGTVTCSKDISLFELVCFVYSSCF